MTAIEPDRGRFAFLYRSDEGTVDAPTWVRGAVPVLLLFAFFTAGWLALKPFVRRSLNERGFFDPLAIGASVYLVLYALAAILLGVCWVNLSTKRFRDRGAAPPVGLASLLPLTLLLDGALRWLQPQIADSLPPWTVYVGDVFVVIALAGTVAVCADIIGRSDP